MWHGAVKMGNKNTKQSTAKRTNLPYDTENISSLAFKLTACLFESWLNGNLGGVSGINKAS